MTILKQPRVIAYNHMRFNKALNDSGLSALLVPLIISVLLLIAAASFGFWAFTERQDYKDNSDQKAAIAVKASEEAIAKKLEDQYNEKEKQPLRTYNGPSAFGSIKIMYPKTWSAYVLEQSSGGSEPLNAYFHPNFVPNVQQEKVNFAVRLQIVARNYDEELKAFDSNIKSGKIKAEPYAAPQMPTILGSRLEGEINQQKNGVLVLLPLRDKTIRIWTESDTFYKDYNESVLQNLSFIP